MLNRTPRILLWPLPEYMGTHTCGYIPHTLSLSHIHSKKTLLIKWKIIQCGLRKKPKPQRSLGSGFQPLLQTMRLVIVGGRCLMLQLFGTDCISIGAWWSQAQHSQKCYGGKKGRCSGPQLTECCLPHFRPASLTEWKGNLRTPPKEPDPIGSATGGEILESTDEDLLLLQDYLDSQK